VAPHAANLVLKDLVVEARLEPPLPRRRRRHLGRGLPAAQNDKVLLGRDGRRVERRVGRVALEDFEVLGGDQL
jgi:hypothetical protein